MSAPSLSLLETAEAHRGMAFHKAHLKGVRIVRKLLVLAGLCLALLATPAAAAVDLGLPPDSLAHFDGNGVFDQSIPGTFDGLGPLPPSVGTELFGVGTISGVAIVPELGVSVWTPSDVGPNFEMTFTFWDAVVTSSSRGWSGTPGASIATLEATYADGARVLLVADSSKDFTSFDAGGGPSLFDLADGEFPTAYTLEDAGYDNDGAPDAGSMFTYANDPDEEVFLDLMLNTNQSFLNWSPTLGFFGGYFSSQDVQILGGSGASQFLSTAGVPGNAWALVFALDTNWAFGADLDIELKTIPEPATLIFLGTGLASLVGYRIRRRMA